MAIETHNEDFKDRIKKNVFVPLELELIVVFRLILPDILFQFSKSKSIILSDEGKSNILKI